MTICLIGLELIMTVRHLTCPELAAPTGEMEDGPWQLFLQLSETTIPIWERHGAVNGVGDKLATWRLGVSRLLSLRFLVILVCALPPAEPGCEPRRWALVKIQPHKRKGNYSIGSTV